MSWRTSSRGTVNLRKTPQSERMHRRMYSSRDLVSNQVFIHISPSILSSLFLFPILPFISSPATDNNDTDIDWYLYKQIFPPIERLCAPIEGTDAVRLADCLGLDTRKYQIQSSSSSSSGLNSAGEIHPLESQIEDEIRFQDAKRLRLRCRACRHGFDFEGLLSSNTGSTSDNTASASNDKDESNKEAKEVCSPTGIKCPNVSCNRILPNLSILAQVEFQVRQQTARYYEGWLVCDDPSCGNKTRQMSVYGHRCLGGKGLAKGCLGRMRYEMPEKGMYNQLLYWQGIWDVEKVGKRIRNGMFELFSYLCLALPCLPTSLLFFF